MNPRKLFQTALDYYQARNLEMAEQMFRKILKVQPGNVEAHIYLGNILQDAGRNEEAVACYQKAIELNPDSGGPYYNIAGILQEKGQLDEALAHYLKVVELDPVHADTYNSIGVIFQAKGRLDDAEAYYRKCLELDPAFAFAYNNLGSVLLKKGFLDEAANSFQKAVQLQPNYAKAYCNLGVALQEKGELDGAGELYEKALRLKPDLSEALNGLGRLFHTRCQFDEAEKYYRRSLRIKADALCYSNLLLMMNYSSRYSPQEVFTEHLGFAEQVAGALVSSIQPHGNDSSPARRLKVGYMSPDFRRHSVNYFLEPVLASHDHENFEIFCYSDVLVPDQVTGRLRGYADRWRDIAGTPDGEVADLVRKDGIDILMDLAGHTGYNRMLVFARKPAPVQASWLGYPNTTGLPTVDYRIVDSYTDPPGVTDPFYTEKLVRLPGSFLCYLPDTESPLVGGPPALASGQITFGSFNNFTKETAEVLALWAEILKGVPGSRLVLKARGLGDKVIRAYAADIFDAHGIGPERIELLSQVSSFAGHLDLYSRIDIGLDPFPYNGTTTTCEALWMGTPVITLEGNTHASRVGVSLLSNIGVPGLIAKTRDEYVEIAVRLATDLDGLKLLHQQLRSMMEQSPLMNAERFTFNLENTFRMMWKKWPSDRE